MMKLLNKIGFIINSADMGFHYIDIWKLLGRDAFDIIIFNDEQSILNIFSGSYNCVKYDEILKQNIKYKYLVSHQFLGYVNGEEKEEYIIKKIGLVNIRFMYALGKSNWNYSEWNKLYDLILCYGPYQIEKLSAFHNTIKLPMGYPRYDEYFKNSIDKDKYLHELKCNPDKQTIVWLPTYSSLSSIDLYAKQISELTDKYNVIVKPHPGVTKQEPKRVRLLESLPFTSFIKEPFNNVYLFSIADYVLCDYGGSSFGAIYTDRNLLLLNIPDADQDSNTGNDSSDIELRKSIINLNKSKFSKIREILSDADYWEKQKCIRKEIRNKYFAPYYGFASNIAAEILSNLEKVFIFENHLDDSINVDQEIKKSEELINQDKLKEAREILNLILNRFPNNKDALNNLAVIEILEKRYNSARNILNNILRIDPNDEIALGNKQYLKEIDPGEM